MPEVATSGGLQGRKTAVSSEQAGRKTGRLRRVAPLACVALLAAGVYALGWHQALTAENFARHHAALAGLVERHLFVALLGYVALYAAAVAVSLPCGAILTTIGGVLFGGFLGGVAAVIGATIGATCLFLIARTAFGEFLARRGGARLERLAEGFRADAFNYLLFLRLVPAFPFFLVNLTPALVGVRLAPFVAATAIGIIPATFVFAFVGAGLADAVASQAASFHACEAAGRSDCRIGFDLGAALTPQLIATFVALGLIALIPVAVKRLQARKRRS